MRVGSPGVVEEVGSLVQSPEVPLEVETSYLGVGKTRSGTVGRSEWRSEWSRTGRTIRTRGHGGTGFYGTNMEGRETRSTGVSSLRVPYGKGDGQTN